MNHVIGVEINIPGISVAMVEVDDKTVIAHSRVYEFVNTHANADVLISSWADAIKKCASLCPTTTVDKIGLAIPGPFDYIKGVSQIINQQKFESLYGVNVKELLARALNFEPEKIRLQNNTPCFLHGEVYRGAVKGYKSVLGFTLNFGLGAARHFEGGTVDANLWNKPFKDGIAEDYVGIHWMSKRYEEFTGKKVSDIKELTRLAQTDDGIGQLIFNEYSENFVKFILPYIQTLEPEVILLGGHNDAWDLFLSHVKDRLGDYGIKLPLVKATLDDDAALIGAADLWKDNINTDR